MKIKGGGKWKNRKMFDELFLMFWFKIPHAKIWKKYTESENK